MGNPITYLFRKSWQYSAGNRKNLVAYWLMLIGANAIVLFGQPLAMTRVIDTVQKEGVTSTNFPLLMFFLAFYFLCTEAFWSLHGPARCIERKNAFIARLNYTKFLLGGVMNLPMEWHVDHHSGDTIDKIEKGTNALFSFMEDSFIVIWALVYLIISVSMLAYFGGPTIAAIVLIMILVSCWITIRYDKVMLPQYEELNKYENQISESVFDAISNISTVIILRVEKLVFTAIVQKMEKPLSLFSRNQRLGETKWYWVDTCVALMTVSVLGVYFWQHIGKPYGEITATTFLLMSYLGKVSDIFFTFTSKYGDIIRYRARVKNGEEVAQDFQTNGFVNHVLPMNWQSVSAEGLTFGYGTGKQAIENVSFTLERGKKYAIVGESGSGKTTLLKIIRDLYSPHEGIVRVDEAVIDDGFAGISRAIALVPQNPEIFATTILENLTIGAEYDMNLVRHYTDMACFTDVAEGLPKQFESSIKEKGVNLSGGQQQRLALGRGLLACHEKDIVLLDEPTSSLDTGTEMKVYQNIFAAFRNKTVVSSIHRLHLLPLFDTIYMFSEGRIIGSGSLQKLLTTSSEFQSLWREYHKHKDEIAPS